MQCIARPKLVVDRFSERVRGLAHPREARFPHFRVRCLHRRPLRLVELHALGHSAQLTEEIFRICLLVDLLQLLLAGQGLSDCVPGLCVLIA